MDALGRETNFVVTAVVVPGSVNVADCATTGSRSAETMPYPDGTSDYTVCTDMRDVRAVSWSHALSDNEESLSLLMLISINVSRALIAKNW